MSETEDSHSTVLVVDDDKPFCAALAGSLRRRGCAAIVAHNFDDALAEAEAWAPDRAVVDLRMPGRGGLKLGATYYLTKPAEPDEILRAFERVEPVIVEPPSPHAAKPLDELEWEHLQQVLTDCNGNVSEAARRLGMHRRSLQRKLARGRPSSGPAAPP
jgi:two-component system response regulator RegA